MSAGPAVRSLDQVAGLESSPGVTVREMLNSAGGCGEAWYVISGTGSLDTERTGHLALAPGTAVWLSPGLGYACVADDALEVLTVTVRAGSAVAGPARAVVRLEDCEPEFTGDREFRVLLSEGLTITQFAGMIPPGRAPAHQHTYDEVVHVLAGRGVVHLDGADTPIGPGTSIYLPPLAPHCLENTGRDPLRVIGIFHPAGSPAAKQVT